MNPENSNGIQEASSERMKSLEPPYKPSWIDRLNRWIANLPINLWLFHFLLGLVLILVQLIFLWVDGGLHATEILPVIVFNSLAVPFLLLLIFLLDQQAVSALDLMKPVLDMTEQEYAEYRYRLSNMPFVAPLLAGLAITVLTVLAPLVSIEPLRYAILDQTPLFSIIYHIIDKTSAFLFGVILYYLVRHLRLVNSIYEDHTHIDLFQLDPLQSLSRVTASTITGLLVFLYAWMLINPELLTDLVLVGIIIIFTIISVSLFLWPLWGIHRIINREKSKVLHEMDFRFEAVALRFNHHLDGGDYDSADRLNGIINSLDIQRKRVSDIPTWPWRSGTTRLILTAIALPLIMMFLQYFILRAIPR